MLDVDVYNNVGVGIAANGETAVLCYAVLSCLRKRSIRNEVIPQKVRSWLNKMAVWGWKNGAKGLR